MLDLQFIVDHLDDVAANCRNRGVKVDLTTFAALRDRRNQIIGEADFTRHEQKEISGQIPKADAASKPALVEKGRQLRERVAALEHEQKQVEAELRAIQLTIPNMTHPDAPVGPDESHSKVVRTWGEPRKFDFKPLDHVELCAKHDLLDMDAGARVAGHGFYFLKNEAALLELALVQYAV